MICEQCAFEMETEEFDTDLLPLSAEQWETENYVVVLWEYKKIGNGCCENCGTTKFGNYYQTT